MAKRSPLQPGNVAVISGAASGIGLACARMCALRYTMQVVLLDIDQATLDAEANNLSDETMETVVALPCDVTSLADWERVQDIVWEQCGGCHFLFLNAGIMGGGEVLKNPSRWRSLFDVNVFGVLYGMQAFVPAMIEQGETAVVATTASRVALTNPASGDAAYNASKASVRALAESLEHSLRNAPDCCVSSRLLLPGTTQTGILTAARRIKGEADSSPGQASLGPTAVQAEDVVTSLLESVVDGGPFYVVCGDGDMSADQFNVAVRWTAEDVAQRRPPLSRWLEPWQSEFRAKL